MDWKNLSLIHVYKNTEEKQRLIVAIYVDLLILSNCKVEERKLKKCLKENFEMKDLGNVKQFLGMNIERNREKGEISINQRDYIKKIIEKFHMQDSN